MMAAGTVATAVLRLLVALGLLSSAGSAWAFACTSAGGNWGTAGTWASCNGTTPQSGDTATITGGTVTLNTNATIAGLTVNGGTLAFGSSTAVRTLTVNGNVAVASGATLNVANFTATHVLNVSGGITNNGTLDLVRDTNSLCTLNFTGGGTHTVGGTSAGTTEFSNVTTANHLTINKTGAVITQTGTLAVSGNLVVTAGTFDLVNTVTVTGTTGVSGSLRITSTTGTKTFTGAVTINSGGVLQETVAEPIAFSGNVTISSGGTLTENGAAAIGIAGNLSNSGTYTTSTGLHTFSGASPQILGTAVISFSGAVTATSALTVNKALGAVTVTGAFNVGATGLTLTAGTLTLANAATITGPTSISGTLLHTTATGLRTFTGAVTIQSGGVWTNTSAAVRFNGNLTVNGTFTSGSGLHTFAGASPQILGSSAITFSGAVTGTSALAINKASGIVTVNGAFTVGATGLTVTAGNLTLANATAITGPTSISGTLVNTTTTGTRTFTGSVTINSGGVWSNTNTAIRFNGNLTVNGTFTSGSGLHTFAGASPQILGSSAITFSGAVNGTTALAINKASGIVTVNGAFTVGATGLTLTAGTLTLANATAISGPTSISGTLAHTTTTGTRALTGAVTIQSGGVWSSTNTPIRLNGDLTINGTFTSGTGLYTFGGAAVQTITNSVGTTVFGGSVTLNNTNGLVLGGTNNVTVTTTLTLTNGLVTTGSNVLYIASGNNVGVTAGRFVVGNLRKRFAPGALARRFEVGTTTGANKYAPVTITFAAVSVAGDITVSTTYGSHPQIASAGIDTGQDVNRYWTITNAGVVFTTYTATFTFVAGAPPAGDVDPAAAPATFIAFRYSASAWNATTDGANTPTTIQVPGLTGFGDVAVGEPGSSSVDAATFDCIETGVTFSPSPARPPLYTKRARVDFTFDVVALRASGAIETNYVGSGSKTVIVELFDDSASPAPACTAYAGSIATQTLTFIATDAGRVTSGVFNIDNAYGRLRCRARDAVPVHGCSSDRFTVRPTAFTSVTSMNANADAAGADETATPAIKAMTSFNISAGTGFSGYSGVTPNVDVANIEWLTPPAPSGVSIGTLEGSFSPAASGTATGNNFTYSEVGYFRFQALAIHDDSFANASGDIANGDCTNDFSNALVGGKYGCNFGNTNATDYFGRFTPDHFDLSASLIVNRSDMGCIPASNFTYMGEPMLATVELSAMNGASTPAITRNYMGAYARFPSGTSWTDIGVDNSIGLWMSASGYPVAPGTCNVAFANTTPFATSFSCTAGVTPPASINRMAGARVTIAATPAPTMSWGTTLLERGIGTFAASVVLEKADLIDGPYGTLNVGVFPRDADGVTVLTSALDLDTNNDATSDRKSAGSSVLRYGRFRMANAFGSDLLPLAMVARTEFFSGAGWVQNTDDSCTTVSAPASPITLTSTPAGAQTNLTCGTIPCSGASIVSTGDLRLSLSAPSPSASGFADIVLDVPTWLEFPWATPAAPDPSGRATFGIYRGNQRLIYRRERY